MPIPYEDRSRSRKRRSRSYGDDRRSPSSGWNSVLPNYNFPTIMGSSVQMPTTFDILANMGIDPVSGNKLVPPAQEIVPGMQFERDNGQGRGGGREQQLNPIQIALAQLDSLINGGPPMPGQPGEKDLQAALDAAAAGIRKQYGAQIGAYAAQNAGAREDVREGSAEIQDMYGALDRSYQRAGKGEFRQGKQLSRQLQGMGERGAQAVTDQTNQMNQSAMEGAAGLGLDNLGQELVQDNIGRSQKMGNRALSSGQRSAETVMQQAGNNRTFFNTTGKASRLEGTNRSADLYADLQDYLQQNRSQMAALAGERAAAVAASQAGITNDFYGQQQDYYGMQTEAQQQLFENKLRLLQLAMDAQEEGVGSKAEEDFYGMMPEQMSGPGRILSSMGDRSVNNLYKELSASDPMRLGYTTDQNKSDKWYMYGRGGEESQVPLVDNYANMQQYVANTLGPDAWGSLSTAQRNALISALMMQLKGFG